MIFIPTPTATQALHDIQQGGSVQTLLNQYLTQVTACEAKVKAWQCIDTDTALKQAKSQDCDGSEHSGALRGIPVGIKDIIATSDFPTEWGTPLHQGQQLGYDATVVEQLRRAGAIILGKTTTTEYASGRATHTTNPHNSKHTPGASSSGSAAAVAAGMVPLAVGTQTMGSILRPAAYCGILGFKPSFGAISRFGIMPVNWDLDHVGCFARSVEDLALLCSVLMVADRRDPDCWAQSFSPKVKTLSRPPSIGVIRGPFWQQMEPQAQSALLAQAKGLITAGAEVREIELPSEFTAYPSHIEALVASGLAVHHRQDLLAHPEQMSPQLKAIVEKARSLHPLAYAEARRATLSYDRYLNSLFSHIDAILTPVTAGPAPLGLENTGSPIFCALWTLCGFPAISIPAGTASNGLPLAVQLVGQAKNDAHLLGIADWIIQGAIFPAN